MDPQLEDFELMKEVPCRVVLMASHCLIACIPTGAVAKIKEGELGVTSFCTVKPCTTHQEVGAPCAPKIKLTILVLLCRQLKWALRRM